MAVVTACHPPRRRQGASQRMERNPNPKDSTLENVEKLLAIPRVPSYIQAGPSAESLRLRKCRDVTLMLLHPLSDIVVSSRTFVLVRRDARTSLQAYVRIHFLSGRSPTP
jgi:hypothetical protein